MEIDISKVKKIHFVGIKGIAMTSLAVYAKEWGYVVSGTDVAEKFPSDDVLAKAKITSLVGFDPSHIVLPDLVIYTGAHGGRDNIEVAEAIKKNIPVLPHGKALGMFMEGKRQISVAGSHGKTTTTAMIATILSHAGRDPSYAIGSGEIIGLGLPGHFGKGDWFIAEADEYATDPGHDATPRFLWQNPEVLVITNIEFDHPDVYASLDEVKAAFQKLKNNVSPTGDIVSLTDGKITASSVRFDEGKTQFQLDIEGVNVGDFTLKVPGKHNAENAALAAVAASRAGVPWEKVFEGLATFGGAKRRFEKIGSIGNTVFYDDYAHHPSEIAATLSAARAWYPKRRILAIFQPHTYSRTKAMLDQFSGAFADATLVITTDIYASAREDDTFGVTGAMLAERIANRHPHAFFAKNKEAVAKLLSAKIQDGDIVIFMGAGDIGNWGKEIVIEMLNDK